MRVKYDLDPNTPIDYPKAERRRDPITIPGDGMEVLVQMSEGNPGAANVLGMLCKDDDMALMRVLDLDDMNMRGSQIWVAFKYHCKGDIERFRKALIDRDPAMVETVNASRGHAPDTPKAVTHGGSHR